MAKIERALISVSDKTHIVAFAKALIALDIEILSTGGTAKILQENGLPVTEVSSYTGFPEMMDGRLKTLHPKIHGGLLGRRGVDDDAMAEHHIPPIDLVVVNLYPFAATIANADCSLAHAIENIDIGGPTLLRAAAKNHQDVGVVVNIADYDGVIAQLQSHGELNKATKFALAVKCFEHTARYDGAIANYLGAVSDEGEKPFPSTFNQQFKHLQTLRYGENPHQDAAFFSEHEPLDACIATAAQHQGKALSYNNIADTDAALECVKAFTGQTTCVIVKHANPCGVALGSSPLEAYQRAFQTDPSSAFGGIIAFNRPLDAQTAQAIIEQQFVEVIIAPEIAPEALTALAKKPNVRVLSSGQWAQSAMPGMDFKRVCGGLLVQQRDTGRINAADLRVVTKRAPDEQEMQDLLFTWKVAKFVKSNAIVYAKFGQTIGIGAGQMSRVYSARIAAIKAQDENLSVAGSVLASDAFFPFRDGLDAAAEAGVTAVIQPGGSMRDDEVIAAADEHNIAMVFTGMRHFKH